MKKILLLNPPGQRLYIRDYYCSKVSKANYINHPIDLLALSGRLAEEYEVLFLDAIMEKLSSKAVIHKIKTLNPHAVISLIGAASLGEDVLFLSDLKREIPGLLLLCSGDIVFDNPQEKLKKYDFIDGFILDFSSPDILEFLKGNRDKACTIFSHKDTGAFNACIGREHNVVLDLPCPRHELFLRYSYRSPFVWHKKFATVLTDFGCPYKCAFCIIGTLGFKYRSVNNVMEELRYLHGLGIRELFFADQSFGALRERNKELCLSLISENFGFAWLCFSRVDLIDEEFLLLMKKSGCHTIIFGVETANEALLKKYNKNYTRNQIKDTFNLCRKLGITTVGTFLIGLPDETESSVLDTIHFALELKADFASFNVAVPRGGTQLREETLRLGLINPGLEIMDQSGETIVMPTRYITRERLALLKKEAVRHFYFRPSYLWHRATNIKNVTRLGIELKNAWALFRLNIK
ncbi:MAG: radical SAM protein [Candidatus Omnitrophota bacterium]